MPAAILANEADLVNGAKRLDLNDRMRKPQAATVILLAQSAVLVPSTHKLVSLVKELDPFAS